MPRGSSVPRLCPHPPALITPRLNLTSSATRLHVAIIGSRSLMMTPQLLMSMFKPHDLLHPFLFTSYILCFFFFQFFFFRPTSFLPSYRLPISVYILSTSSSSPHNNTSVPYFISFHLSYIHTYSCQMVVVVVIPTASARTSPPSTSSLHQMLDAILDPTLLYNLNLVFQLPLLLPLALCYLLPTWRDTLRHSSVRLFFFFSIPFSPFR